jgi:hypothetical protein
MPSLRIRLDEGAIQTNFFCCRINYIFFWLAPSGVDFFYKKNTYHTCGLYLGFKFVATGKMEKYRGVSC